MTTTTTTTASQHHAAIQANVEDMLAKRISFRTFSERASALHAAARADGAAVEDELRERIRLALDAKVGA